MMITALILAVTTSACNADDAVCLRNRVLELRGEKTNLEEALDLERSATRAARSLAAQQKTRAEDWQQVAGDASKRSWSESHPGALYGGGVVTGVVLTALTVFLLSR